MGCHVGCELGTGRQRREEWPFQRPQQPPGSTVTLPSNFAPAPIHVEAGLQLQEDAAWSWMRFPTITHELRSAASTGQSLGESPTSSAACGRERTISKSCRGRIRPGPSASRSWLARSCPAGHPIAARSSGTWTEAACVTERSTWASCSEAGSRAGPCRCWAWPSERWAGQKGRPPRNSRSGEPSATAY